MTSSPNNGKEFIALTTRGWVSLRQFCVLADVSYPTGQKLLREGKINGVKVGGITRIYADELRRFLKEGNAPAVGSASEGLKTPHTLPSIPNSQELS